MVFPGAMHDHAIHVAMTEFQVRLELAGVHLKILGPPGLGGCLTDLPLFHADSDPQGFINPKLKVYEEDRLWE